MRILGHRGASHDFPENTVAAFRGAIEQGADGVELDVMCCKTGELVVCHDENLQRLVGIDSDVAFLPWSTLQELDVGTHLGFAPAGIPLLQDVVSALRPDTFINVELKCITFDDGGLAEAVGAFLADGDLLGRTVVSSFNVGCLVRLAQRYPEIPRGYLIDPERSFELQTCFEFPLSRPTSVHPHHSQCTPARVARWKASGLQVAVWTVDDPDVARELVDMGVDILISNTPAALRQALRSP